MPLPIRSIKNRLSDYHIYAYHTSSKQRALYYRQFFIQSADANRAVKLLDHLDSPSTSDILYLVHLSTEKILSSYAITSLSYDDFRAKYRQRQQRISDLLAGVIDTPEDTIHAAINNGLLPPDLTRYEIDTAIERFSHRGNR